MSKKSTMNFMEKFKNPKYLTRSIFTIIFSVILFAAIIAANIFSTNLALTSPVTADVTDFKSNTLSENNVEFLKNIKNPVEIIVCAPEIEYRGAEYVSYVYDKYYVEEKGTTDNYFNQTLNLLKAYRQHNNNITIKFADPQKPEFRQYESESDVEIEYGDILVRSTRTDKNGKNETYQTVVTFADLYEVYDPTNGQSMMSGNMPIYVIAASKAETSISSAIFTVAASTEKKIALLTSHSTKDAELAFTAALDGYNFVTMQLDRITTPKALEGIDTVLLVAPVSDLSGSELEILEAFLDNDGKRGKNFMVFGSNASPATPNLNAFLEEWGIKVEDGMAYETNSGYRFPDGQTMFFFNKENLLTQGLKASELSCYCADNVALSVAYEGEEATKGTRTANVLMTTSPYAVKAPKGVNGYTPSSKDVVGEMPVVIVTSDTTMDSNYNEISSYVTYFASADFINEAWSQFGDNGNMDYAVTIANVINGRSGSSIYFDPKITGYYTVKTPFTEEQCDNISTFGITVLPLLLVIGGVVVWFLRRRR